MTDLITTGEPVCNGWNYSKRHEKGFNQPESDGSRTTELHITHRHDAQGQYGLIIWFLFFF
jgi:hypothetical protein